MYNKLALKLWMKIPEDKEELVLQRMKVGLIILIVATIFAGFFCFYRLGEYIQTRRIASQAIVVPVQQN